MMLSSDCLCQKNSSFTPIIFYKNETVFRNFNGAVVGRCSKCGLLKTISRPKNKFNPQTTHANFYEDNKKLFNKLFQPIVEGVKEIKNEGLVLDIGCSSGILIELFKKNGFNFYGVEPNEKAYLLSTKKFNGKIFFGYLSDFVKNNKIKFDVVVYNHVLEHVKDIKKELKLVKKILKPAGLLVIGIPNTRNIIFSLRKKYWEYLVPLEHYWHFSDRYLKKYLAKNGFEIVNIEFSDDPRSEYPVLKRIYFLILSIVNKIFNSGELMTIYAKHI